MKVGDTIDWKSTSITSYIGTVTKTPAETDGGNVGWAQVTHCNGEPIEPGTFPSPITFHISTVTSPAQT